MRLPVSNWSKEFEGVKLYHDLIDSAILHYGPNVTWSTLLRQDFGVKYTILRGNVDFDCSPNFLKDLQSKFPGFGLVPLVAQDSNNKIVPIVEISKPHSLNLSVIPTHPFPQLSFSLTVSHTDVDYEILIEKVSDAWGKKDLFKGGIRFSYASRLVRGSYLVNLQRDDVEIALRGVLVGNKWARTTIVRKISDVISSNQGKWLRSNVPQGFSNDVKNVAELFVVDKISTMFFQTASPLIAFDNGEKVEAVEMATAATLEKKLEWTLNKSDESLIEICLLD